MDDAFLIDNLTSVSGGVRLVISLNADTAYLDGSGTKESPYVIIE